MNETLAQVIAAVAVVGIIAGLVYLTVHYAEKAQKNEDAQTDAAKLAKANVVAAGDDTSSDAADRLQVGQF